MRYEVRLYRGASFDLWLCLALEVSRSGFHAWLTQPRSQHAKADAAIALRWSRLIGQFDGRVKLGSGCRQAASLCATPSPYASSGVLPPNVEWGRRVL